MEQGTREYYRSNDPVKLALENYSVLRREAESKEEKRKIPIGIPLVFHTEHKVYKLKW